MTSNETAGYRSRYASRHVRHVRAMVYIEIDNPWWRENIPGILGATRNYTYLAKTL